jgi:hypothetical protein
VVEGREKGVETSRIRRSRGQESPGTPNPDAEERICEPFTYILFEVKTSLGAPHTFNYWAVN